MTPKRFPREFEPVWVIGEKNPSDPMSLTYSRDRGFFEPLTNQAAEPIIGQPLAWKYRCEDLVEDCAAYEAVRRAAVEGR